MTEMVTGLQCADPEKAFDLRTSDGPPVRKGRGLTDWAAFTPELPVIADPALAAAVQERAEYWAFRGLKALELAAGAAPRHMHWPTLVQRFAPRRLWHRLHCREMEWEAPLTRGELARLVPQMFQNHLLELLKRPIPGMDADPDPDPDPEAEPTPVAPDDPRLLATRRALAEDEAGAREMIALLLAHDRRWETLYRRITSPHADACLTAAEFRDWALRNYGDPDNTRGDR
jgi:hypothetical protein